MPEHTRPARGMRDFLPEDVRRRDYVIAIVRDVYQRYGFEPLETPSLENIETLTGKYGEEGNKLIYKVLRRAAEVLQALPDSARVARRSARPRALSRVLSVRRRLHRIAVDGGRGGIVLCGVRRADQARF